ncbi:MAG TPA: alpha/beta hydrolase [Solirubrobacteraceae bacterium]|nr:alpha/beta hydrolase [Solirubrobacteraceae bacterium]
MKLPYDQVGDGAPVVLLHAGVADRTMWREHVEPLGAAGYRVIAIDLPGFGEAPPPTGEDAPWWDVLETMDALGVERATLVGNSFGGAVALRVAALAPDRVAALALISAPPPDLEEPSPELEAAWEAESSALERGDIEAAVRAVVEAWTVPGAPPALRDSVARMQRRAFIAQADAPEVPEGPDPLDQTGLAEVVVPALVAVGERDMPDFREGARRMADQLPGARHVEIADAGHLAPLETPEAFRELLLGFLADR